LSAASFQTSGRPGRVDPGIDREGEVISMKIKVATAQATIRTTTPYVGQL
jgi:hypothetical protein